MRKAVKLLILFCFGGGVYALIELLWRGHSHWTMFILGGALFLLIGGINEVFPWGMPLPLQGAIGAVAVTIAEFFAGCVLNLWLGLNIWDYYTIPLNLLGQVCLPFTVLWLFLAVAAVFLDDWLRHFLFGEEEPHYVLFP